MNELDRKSLCALPHLFDIWALDHQRPPDGDWRAWVILGGRGAGKTRAGAEWVRSLAEGARPHDLGTARRIALVAETYDQVRDVMVHGDSGILACSPPDRRPRWKASERKLIWPNGAEAQAFSAHDPEALRGPQFDAAWADELAKWKKGQDSWDMLQFALRLGQDPRVCVTTTPRSAAVLKRLLASPSTVTTHAPTEANRANLAASFLAEVRERYAGSRLGRQELDGVLLSDIEGALWTTAALEAAKAAEAPPLDRVVVAVDPAVSAGKRSDACGIVVAGAVTQGPPQDWQAFVLADCTVQGATPMTWAQAVIDARDRFGADRVVAEVNQGGALVETVLRQADALMPFRALHARKGKSARAEPVAALYEQGRVRHLPGLGDLEDQMCQMTPQGFCGSGSPDRVDALVWALHELIIQPAANLRRPQVRVL
ncbi:DNA-packaging protein [Leisingera sp. S232]|uniref:DNA-packaging protein n=1 Tax=Leisingera sp. S232 TaxID=3415132 RepID=UPI003C7B716E